MKNLSDTIILHCLVYISVMGALSPGPSNGFVSHSLPDHWKNNSTPILIYSRTGYHLQILPNGTVRGTMDNEKSDNFVYMLITPRAKHHGVGSVVIQAIQTERYLCMNAQSIVYSAVRTEFNSVDCTWIEVILPNWFNAYKHSHHKKRRKRFYLAISKEGVLLHGNISRKSQKSGQFLKQGIKDSGNRKPYNGFLGLEKKTAKVPVAQTASPQEKPRRNTKLGCKGLQTKYCKRMRKRMFKGKSIRHAKRHRKCRNMRREKLKSALSAKQLRRLIKHCNRIRRKRQERRRRKHRTSTLPTALASRTTSQTPHRT